MAPVSAFGMADQDETDDDDDEDDNDDDGEENDNDGDDNDDDDDTEDDDYQQLNIYNNNEIFFVALEWT